VETLVRIEGARLGYGRKTVLADANLVLAAGEFWGCVGPNGAGKTTLLRAIAGLLPAVRGTVWRRERLGVGYVPQRQTLDALFPFSAFDVVELAARVRHGRRTVREETLRALEAAGAADLQRTAYRDLSGGQKQRVLLARALAVEPDVLLLDEPVTDLDPAAQWAILDLLSGIRARHGTAVFLVTHQLELAVNYAEKFAFVGRGGVRTGVRDDFCRAETLHDVFGIDATVSHAAGRWHLIPRQRA
jgi:ABC-type Mn2+/Zn2+ transport system ATPase subunit